MPDISAEVWPQYNRHGDVLNRYWLRREEDFGAFQFALYDEDAGEVLAEGHTARVRGTAAHWGWATGSTR